jgi:hypothetical protein
MFEDRDGHAIAVVALNIADDHVQTIHAVANPEKLRHLDRPTPPGVTPITVFGLGAPTG